jgi:hypothetical protein
MLTVEYLVFNDKKTIKSASTDSFNHLLQSDPQIEIQKNKLICSGLSVEYQIEMGNVGNSDNIYFHLKFRCADIKKIEDFSKLLRAVKAVLHLTNKTPQTLYDGISHHYSQLAYPNISEVENLMRKLITKFMMINTGVEWTKDRVPEDVKKSINPENIDATYLHNVDFIQLKNFLFSENYPVHKENLVQKLKNAKELKDIDLNEIKLLIPISNWDKFFYDKVACPKEQLSKQWDELYELRCRVAHNKAFTKADLDKSDELCKNLKEVLTKAIDNLDKIKLSEIEQADITEIVAGNFNHLYGEFLARWRSLTKVVYMLVDEKIKMTEPELVTEPRLFSKDLNLLIKTGVIDRQTYVYMRKLNHVRNQIVYNSDALTQEEVLASMEDLKSLTNLLDGYR